MNLDRIVIEDLRLRCLIGVHEEERRLAQEVLVRIEMFADLRAAACHDDLNATVDYKQVKYQVKEFVESSSFYLVEALASGVAQICLRHQRVASVRVRVDKPGALRFARSVGVEIERCEQDYRGW